MLNKCICVFIVILSVQCQVPVSTKIKAPELILCLEQAKHHNICTFEILCSFCFNTFSQILCEHPEILQSANSCSLIPIDWGPIPLRHHHCVYSSVTDSNKSNVEIELWTCCLTQDMPPPCCHCSCLCGCWKGQKSSVDSCCPLTFTCIYHTYLSHWRFLLFLVHQCCY